MELFTKLYAAWLLFTYHCFDRIVISGYLMGMQRCGQVVYWLQNVLGITAIDKAALSKRSGEYVQWVEAFARKQKIPLEWWEKGVNKEEYVRPYLHKAERAGRWGVYCSGVGSLGLRSALSWRRLCRLQCGLALSPLPSRRR